jgi:hypothetical protein
VLTGSIVLDSEAGVAVAEMSHRSGMKRMLMQALTFLHSCTGEIPAQGAEPTLAIPVHQRRRRPQIP